MADIVLTTLNARYVHAAFGLRYLMANLGELRERATILEFDLTRRTVDMVEVILAHRPGIVGVGVYIWNVQLATQLVADLKRIAPEVVVVLGGPEVSHETEGQEIVGLADYVIAGEGEVAFAELCRGLLRGERPGGKALNFAPVASEGAEARSGWPGCAESGEDGGRVHPPYKSPSRLKPVLQTADPALTARRAVIHAASPDLEKLVLPYELYDQADIAHRVIYVEASRGCPFECEFCLSSLDERVRAFSVERFLEAMGGLLERGVRQFKFVDRTFNLNIGTARAILDFFRERHRPGLFVHFEMIPDRLPAELREAIRGFEAGTLQFEVGVQTFNPEVAERIGRRQDNRKVVENLRWLRQETGVHLHADLIAGLPGEDLAGFGAGFDRLAGLRPHEIQLGILKRLRGAPIARHDERWGMVYSANPPYEILRTGVISFAEMQRVRRFARYWDMVANSGNFREAAPLILGEGSVFWGFMRFADWLYGRAGRTHAIAMNALAEMVFEYLVGEAGCTREAAAGALWEDYRRGGRRDVPEFLSGYVLAGGAQWGRRGEGPPRQGRHGGG